MKAETRLEIFTFFFLLPFIRNRKTVCLVCIFTVSISRNSEKEKEKEENREEIKLNFVECEMIYI